MGYIPSNNGKDDPIPGKRLLLSLAYKKRKCDEFHVPENLSFERK